MASGHDPKDALSALLLFFFLLRAQCLKTKPTKKGEQGHALHTIHMRMARIIHVHVHARFLAGKLPYIIHTVMYGVHKQWLATPLLLTQVRANRGALEGLSLSHAIPHMDALMHSRGLLSLKE